ncbi:hypothetical protein CI109_104989 [Kwoniella shandongensis]|uniref:Glycosyltransferase 61 catalytic domain-containing protein n=1 Tax=Kwoniella shandongensis TaxID=1734106 RepID=A0A5M6BSM2_9TREE|nr:uncharacterized protein CI109_006704 [Kwoniella shandongensis]KAA5524980.1 hypothetical protein CI109_006704 [Kwoniella shandongensis]
MAPFTARIAIPAILAPLLVFTFLTHASLNDKYDINHHIDRLSGGRFGSTTTGGIRKQIYVPESEYPETEWINGVAGFNYFHNLYLTNGTFLIVTSNPDSLPPGGVNTILSGLSDPNDRYHNHHAAQEDRMMVVTPEEAKERMLLRKAAVRKTGVSMFFNEVREGTMSSFLGHYFHCEMFLGAWRVVTSAGESELPSRIMYRAQAPDWRDNARITTWFQQSVLPETLVEESTIWEDREKSQMTFLFDKIAIADRWAAHRAGIDVKYWNKANADLPKLEVPINWLDPLRDQIKRLVIAEGCEVKRDDPKVPVVVYIDRQFTGRRLVDHDAKELLEEMNKLHEEGVIEFHDAVMERLHRTDQFCLALKADIMFGVHGNGLSHQLWMKPGGAVMEIMAVGGFARDYAILSEMMGHEYHAVHYNTTLPREKWTRPDGWAIGQNEDFHSARITVDGKWMAGKVRAMAKARVGVVEPRLPY